MQVSDKNIQVSDKIEPKKGFRPLWGTPPHPLTSAKVITHPLTFRKFARVQSVWSELRTWFVANRGKFVQLEPKKGFRPLWGTPPHPLTSPKVITHPLTFRKFKVFGRKLRTWFEQTRASFVQLEHFCSRKGFRPLRGTPPHPLTSAKVITHPLTFRNLKCLVGNYVRDSLQKHKSRESFRQKRTFRQVFGYKVSWSPMWTRNIFKFYLKTHQHLVPVFKFLWLAQLFHEFVFFFFIFFLEGSTKFSILFQKTRFLHYRTILIPMTRCIASITQIRVGRCLKIFVRMGSVIETRVGRCGRVVKALDC